MITQNHLDRSMSYGQYRKLTQELVEQNKTTGGNQSEAYLHYTKMNHQRMQRLDKTTGLLPELREEIKALQNRYTWLVLTEAWCGDAAQSLPVMHLVAETGSHIDLKLLLRDENLDVMDQYLTNGSRSIPKLICLDQNGLAEKFTWGPRPEAAQAMVQELLAKGLSKEEKSLAVQQWYNNDKTLSVQQELLSLIRLYLT